MKELQKKIIKEQKKSCKLERLQHNIQKIGMKTEVDIKKSVNTKMLKWKETVKKSTKKFQFFHTQNKYLPTKLKKYYGMLRFNPILITGTHHDFPFSKISKLTAQDSTK